jgi:hypothetical protein
MIKIPLDEGYVFDIFSIYEVKISKSSSFDKEKLNLYLDFIKSEIINQIGSDLFNKIYYSEEYKLLKQANEETFALVDKAKLHEGLAKEIDTSNYNRYKKKTMLQKKFFNNEIKEVKIGYSND